MTTTGRRGVRGLTLDTGALFAFGRGDSWVRALLRRVLETGLPLSILAGVVAQTWRGGPRRACATQLLADPNVHMAPLDDTTTRAVGLLCGCNDRRDIVDVHIALLV